MNPNTMAVIASYLPPNELGSFFITHSIPFTTSFIYDGSWFDKYAIYISLNGISYNWWISIFPSIIIIGISITLKGYLISLINLQHIIGDFPNIRRIICSECNEDTCVTLDISYVKNLTNLKTIKFPTSHILDIEPLTHCKSLRHLDMSKCFDIQNTCLISNHLYKIKKYGFPRTSDVPTFPPKLKELTMFSDMNPKFHRNCGPIDMQNIPHRNMRKLKLYACEFVNFRQCNRIVHLSLFQSVVDNDTDEMLRCMPSIKFLAVHVGGLLYDVGFVTGLCNLKTMYILVTREKLMLNKQVFIQSMEQISKCVNLKYLMLDLNDQENMDVVLKSVWKCTGLKHLYLCNTVGSIDGLNKLSNLKLLSLNNVRNIYYNYKELCVPNIKCNSLRVVNGSYYRIIIHGQFDYVNVEKCDNLRNIDYCYKNTVFYLDRSVECSIVRNNFVNKINHVIRDNCGFN